MFSSASLAYLIGSHQEDGSNCNYCTRSGFLDPLKIHSNMEYAGNAANGKSKQEGATEKRAVRLPGD